MVVHLVLFKPRPGLDTDDRQRLAAALGDALRQIPSVRRAQIGRRVTHGRPYEHLMRVDYTHVAILEFESVDGLKQYLQHPAHDALAARFFEAVGEALMYDYQVADDAAGIELVAAAD